MQLLDSLQNQVHDAPPAPLLAALQDIVSKVQIQSHFCIRHPDYKPLELPVEAVERFGQLPLELQRQYLSLQLGNFLYGIYYNGCLQSALAPDAVDAAGLAVHQNLENNTFLGVDLAFYERLHKSNSGEGYFNPGWQVLKQESDGSLAVTKDSLILHIDRDRHLQPEAQSAAVGDSVAIWMPRNQVQNGFYIAVGNGGPNSYSNPDHLETVRVYFNLSSEGGVAVMGSLTRQLNAITLPFTFKALYNPSDYGRYDSAVLYFEKNNYETIRSVLHSVYIENQSHFHKSVPLFTKLLAPGLALAEEPIHKFTSQESFGTNRCQIVANGLLEAWQNGDNSTENRMRCILYHFSLLKIELNRPYLNANSEDIYVPLEL